MELVRGFGCTCRARGVANQAKGERSATVSQLGAVHFGFLVHSRCRVRHSLLSGQVITPHDRTMGWTALGGRAGGHPLARESWTALTITRRSPMCTSAPPMYVHHCFIGGRVRGRGDTAVSVTGTGTSTYHRYRYRHRYRVYTSREIYPEIRSVYPMVPVRSTGLPALHL